MRCVCGIRLMTVFTLAPAFFGEGFATEVVVTGKRSPSRQYLTDAGSATE